MDGIVNPSEWPHGVITPWSEEVKIPKKVSFGAGVNSYSLMLDREIVWIKNGVTVYETIPFGRSFRLERMQGVKVTSFEQIDIPLDMAGLMIGKSSINRLGVNVFSGFFDSGFHSKASIYLVNMGMLPVNLYVGEGIVQLILWKTSSKKQYNGSYQGSTSGFVESIVNEREKELEHDSIPEGVTPSLLSVLSRQNRESSVGRYDATSTPRGGYPDTD